MKVELLENTNLKSRLIEALDKNSTAFKKDCSLLKEQSVYDAFILLIDVISKLYVPPLVLDELYIDPPRVVQIFNSFHIFVYNLLVESAFLNQENLLVNVFYVLDYYIKSKLLSSSYDDDQAELDAEFNSLLKNVEDHSRSFLSAESQIRRFRCLKDIYRLKTLFDQLIKFSLEATCTFGIQLVLTLASFKQALRFKIPDDWSLASSLSGKYKVLAIGDVAQTLKVYKDCDWAIRLIWLKIATPKEIQGNLNKLTLEKLIFDLTTNVLTILKMRGLDIFYFNRFYIKMKIEDLDLDV